MNLARLNLADNQLKSLTKAIGNLGNLWSLNLANNPLTDIASKLYRGQDLVKLKRNLARPKPHVAEAQVTEAQVIEGQAEAGKKGCCTVL